MLQTYNYINFAQYNREKIVLKQLFSYTHPEGVTTTAELSIGLSKQLASFIVLDQISGKPRALSFFEVEEWGQNSISTFLEYCSNLGSYSSIQLFVAPTEQTLLPISQFEKEALRQHHQLTLPNISDSVFLHESYADWQFYVGYSIPSAVLQAIKTAFPSCGIKHVFKPILYNLPERIVEGTLCIDVCVQQFSIVLFRGHQLLFCNTFSYTSEFDTLYFLLKICRENLLQTSDVQVFLSGLIDSSSKLYAELGSYFRQLAFRENDKDWSDIDLPTHYFTVLSNNLQCVS